MAGEDIKHDEVFWQNQILFDDPVRGDFHKPVNHHIDLICEHALRTMTGSFIDVAQKRGD